MKRALVVAGLFAGALAGSWLAFSTAGNAGGCCGGGGSFTPGQGGKTSDVPWDNSITVPSDAVETGPGAKAAAPQFSVEDLKKGKPLLVYYYVEGLADAKDESYRFSQQFEVTALTSDAVMKNIKTSWRAKKVALDVKADRKDAKNQARLEFWSFTGAKLGAITLKESDQVKPSSLAGKLASFATKNRDLCAKEIKRIEDAAKASAAGGK